MQIRLFSKYILVAILGFATFSLAAQSIEVENACALETMRLQVSGLTDVPENISWVVDDVARQTIDTMALEEVIGEVKSIEVMAFWEVEVLQDSMLVTVRDTLTRTVNVEECPCDVGMPNVFTPDATGGDIINATFGGMFRNPCNARYALFQLQIYTRWGEMIYDSCEGQSIPCRSPRKWNGETSGENPLPPDTYVYVLQYQIQDIPGGVTHEVVREQGEVVLLR